MFVHSDDIIINADKVKSIQLLEEDKVLITYTDGTAEGIPITEGGWKRLIKQLTWEEEVPF